MKNNELKKIDDKAISIFKKLNNKKIIIPIVVVSIIVLIIGIFICINRLNRNTYNNMYISNLNVSNMSKEKVLSLLEKEQEKINNTNLTLVN
ncbi:MAG: hypothetical protein RSE41_10010, partial [Clostridia bacterium]